MKGKLQKGIKLAAAGLLLVCVFFVYEKFNESLIPELDPGSVSFSKSISFGAIVDAASHEMGSGKDYVLDTEAAKREIDLISELGADVVRFNLERRSLEDAGELEKLDTVLDYVREKKMKICLAYQGRESWLGSDEGRGRSDWKGFRTGYKEDVAYLMQRYKPEYILILPDCPYGVGRQVDSKKSAGEWFNYAKEVGLAAKQVNFSTNVVLEGALWPQGEKTAELEFADAVMGSNDISVNVFSMRAGDMDELEKGMENLLALQKKYHWGGDVWMGNIASLNKDAARQEDFLLYALYLADANDLSGVILGRLTDDARDDNGILKADHTAKDAYTAIKEVMTRRDELFYSN